MAPRSVRSSPLQREARYRHPRRPARGGSSASSGTTWKNAAEHRPHHAVPDVCLQTAPAPADRLRPEPGGRQRVPLVVHRPVPKPVRLSTAREAILRRHPRRHDCQGTRRPRALRRAVAAGRAVTRAWFTQRAHPETVHSTRGSARVVHRKTCRAGPAASPTSSIPRVVVLDVSKGGQRRPSSETLSVVGGQLPDNADDHAAPDACCRPLPVRQEGPSERVRPQRLWGVQEHRRVLGVPARRSIPKISGRRRSGTGWWSRR